MKADQSFVFTNDEYDSRFMISFQIIKSICFTSMVNCLSIAISTGLYKKKQFKNNMTNVS